MVKMETVANHRDLQGFSKGWVILMDAESRPHFCMKTNLSICQKHWAELWASFRHPFEELSLPLTD